MFYKHIITYTTILLAISGIGLLFFPSKMLAIVGIVSNQQLDFLLRASGVGVISLAPGAWMARTSPTSPVSRAVLVGLALYMLFSSVVDFYAYTRAIVNANSIPSMGFRIMLGVVIVLPMFKEWAKSKQSLG